MWITAKAEKLWQRLLLLYTLVNCSLEITKPISIKWLTWPSQPWASKEGEVTAPSKGHFRALVINRQSFYYKTNLHSTLSASWETLKYKIVIGKRSEKLMVLNILTKIDLKLESFLDTIWSILFCIQQQTKCVKIFPATKSEVCVPKVK